MNAIGAPILLVLILAVLSAPRRWAMMAMMAGVLYLPETQQLDVFGFNFFPQRFLELAGFIRVMSRQEFSFRQMNGIDKALLWLYGFMTVVFLLRSTDGRVNQIGDTVDVFLAYFAFRGLLSNVEDFRWFLRAFVLLLAPYALLVVMQSLTGHNPFGILGAPDGGDWRKGRPRCDGSFRQPDLLGMFAASFIPLFVGLGCMATNRKRAFLAICFCLIIVWAANSGGAAGAAVTGLVCWGFWRFRTEMWKVRRGLVAALILLALVMKAPIWFIFDRISSITGGDGWHRSYLIDVSLRHLSQWWFVGMSLTNTSDWFAYVLPKYGVADITNLYIGFGLQAGLVAIALFIVLLTRAFSNLGKALAVVRSSPSKSSADEFLLFGLGVMLVVHIIDWFGITYFDQMYMVWFMQLAAISTLSQAYLVQPAVAPMEKATLEPEVEASQPAPGFDQADATQTP